MNTNEEMKKAETGNRKPETGNLKPEAGDDLGWMEPGWVIVDVETTGLDARACGLIEIGGMAWNGDIFMETCRPHVGARVDDGALKVNGWTRRELDRIDVLEETAVIRLFEWLAGLPGAADDGLTVCGMNPGFDLDFVNAAEARHGLDVFGDVWLGHRVVDLHGWACAVAKLRGIAVPRRGFYSDAVSDLLCVPREEKPHHADAGVMWTAACFARAWEWLGTSRGRLAQENERLRVELRKTEGGA